MVNGSMVIHCNYNGVKWKVNHEVAGSSHAFSYGLQTCQCCMCVRAPDFNDALLL